MTKNVFVNNDIYKDRSLRNIALNELLNKLKEIQPNATTECVRKKKLFKNCFSKRIEKGKKK